MTANPMPISSGAEPARGHGRCVKAVGHDYDLRFRKLGSAQRMDSLPRGAPVMAANVRRRDGAAARALTGRAPRALGGLSFAGEDSLPEAPVCVFLHIKPHCFQYQTPHSRQSSPSTYSLHSKGQGTLAFCFCYRQEARNVKANSSQRERNGVCWVSKLFATQLSAHLSMPPN